MANTRAPALLNGSRIKSGMTIFGLVVADLIVMAYRFALSSFECWTSRNMWCTATSSSNAERAEPDSNGLNPAMTKRKSGGYLVHHKKTPPVMAGFFV